VNVLLAPVMLKINSYTHTLLSQQM